MVSEALHCEFIFQFSLVFIHWINSKWMVIMLVLCLTITVRLNEWIMVLENYTYILSVETSILDSSQWNSKQFRSIDFVILWNPTETINYKLASVGHRSNQWSMVGLHKRQISIIRRNVRERISWLVSYSLLFSWVMKKRRKIAFVFYF